MTLAAGEVRTIDSTRGLDVLVDALDALLDTGVVLIGDVIISVGGVDLIRIDLRALVAGVGALEEGEAP